MKRQDQDFVLRRPAVVDAQAVLELMIARDIADYGEPDSSLEDLLYEWGDIDLNQDAWLLFAPDSALAGYAAVYGNSAGFTFDFYTHPAYAADNLGGYLLAHCEARIAAQMAVDQELKNGTASTIVALANEADRQALENAGFRPQKYYFRMLIKLDDLPAAPDWPADCELRTINPGQDDQLIYDFIQAAFDRPGRTPPSFESWRDYMMRPDHFVPELWFLLFRRQELIGAALCYDYPEFGWVRQLGVSPTWRGRGLGSSLLRHSFRAFFERGHEKVALGVDSTNPTAYSLYEKVGMSCVRRYDEYHKDLEAL